MKTRKTLTKFFIAGLLVCFGSLSLVAQASNTTLSQMSTTDLIKTILTFMTGGLAGAALTWFTTRARHRVDNAIKVIDYFFSSYNQIANVKAILLATKSSNPNDIDENLVRKFGDWFNLVAILYENKSIERGFVKNAGLADEIIAFKYLALQAPWAQQDFRKYWPVLYTFTP